MAHRKRQAVLTLAAVLSILMSNLNPLWPGSAGTAYAQRPPETEPTITERVPLSLALPSNLQMNTLDGSITLGRQDLLCSSSELPLTFALTWNSDSGWEHSWDIYYEEQRVIVGAAMTVVEMLMGTSIHWGGNRSIKFNSRPSPDFEGPDGYGLRTMNSTPTQYRMRTPDGTYYYFDNPSHRHVTKIETPRGRYLAFYYTSAGQLGQIKDDYGRSLILSYDGNGRLTSVTDNNTSPNRTVAYEYDSAGNLTRVTNPLGEVTEYRYTACSKCDLPYLLTELTDPRGVKTTISYFPLVRGDDLRQQVGRRRVSRVQTPLTDHHFQYQASGTLQDYTALQETTTVQEINAGTARTTTYQFVGGRPTVITNPAGKSINMSWDKDSRLASVTDENHHTTSYQYDQRGNRTAVIDPLGNTTRYTFDATFNQVTRITDPNGNTTYFGYDSQGNLISQTDPLSNTTHLDWQNGYLVRITDPLSQTTQLGYDSYGNIAVITNSLGYTQRLGYDVHGSVEWAASANHYTSTFSYDPLGRLIAASDPLSNTYLLEYDAMGNLARLTDPNADTARYTYDDLGRRLSTVDPLGGVTRSTYDAAGNLTSITDPAGHRSTSAYDQLDQLVAMTDPLGNQVAFSYDAAGNVKTRTDAEGRVTTYSYDAANRLIGIDYPHSSDVIRQYDDAGQLTLEANGSVTLTYSYDNAGRNTAVHIAPFNKIISYTYDAAGNRATMIDPDGGLTRYTYDAAGQLTHLTDPQNRTTEFVRDADGRIVRQIFPNGAYVDVIYDQVGRIQALIYRDPADALLLSRSYTYDGAGNRLSVTDQAGGTTSYTYDALSQLTGVRFPDSSSVAYLYDPAGNRTLQVDASGAITYTYNAGDQLLAATGRTFGYDRDGNRVGEVSSTETLTYTYNEENLLAGIQQASGQSTTFSYYPDGRRLSRNDASGTTVYFYDQLNVLLETDHGGPTTARYTSVGIDRWIAQDMGTATRYYLPDAIGSIIGLLDPAGALVEQYAYDPFGAPIAGGGGSNPYLFAGRRYEDNWYLNRARIYDPTVGRFTTQDPAGMPDGPNRYLYALNNPATYTDPLGLACGKPSTFGECHSNCMGFLNPHVVQLANLAAGGLGAGVARKSTALGDKLLAASAAKDALAMAHKPKEPWWSPGISGVINVVGNVLTGAGVTLKYALTKGLLAGGAAIAGAVFAGWGAGTFAGCSLACLADREAYDFAATCPPKKPTTCTCANPPCSCGQPPKPQKPPNPPGGDHPDDTLSVASGQLPMPGAGARPAARVAVLWNGFAEEAAGQLAALGEAYRPVPPDLPPDLAAELPLLLIPSGGLYGIDQSMLFRARLQSYVDGGGTILALDQQHGYEWEALPPSNTGGRPEGYGWLEDNSCFWNSLFVPDWKPALAGFSGRADRLTIPVDGYFDRLPSDASVILRRVANGMPALVSYPAGNGMVIASSVYLDWGASFSQITSDGEVLLRDLISWAIDPFETLPEYHPTEPVTLPVTVTNSLTRTAAAVRLLGVSPTRQVVISKVVSSTVPADSSVLLSYTNSSGHAPEGIWWVDYELLDAAGQRIQNRALGRRFVILSELQLGGYDKTASLRITAPSEYPAFGAQMDYTFHVYNHTTATLPVQVDFGFPHHYWESDYDPLYASPESAFYGLHQALSVAPSGETTFTYQVPVFTTDRLWARLMRGDQLLDQAHFGIYGTAPKVQLIQSADQPHYALGETALVTATAVNLGESAVPTFSLQLEAFDPSGGLVADQEYTLTLPFQGTAQRSFSFSLPISATYGAYQVIVSAKEDQTLLGFSVLYLSVPTPRLALQLDHPATILPGASTPLTLTVANVGQVDLVSETLTLEVLAPNGAQTFTRTDLVSLAAGQNTALFYQAAFSHTLGIHQIRYGYGADPTVALAIPFSNQLGLALDRSHYRAGESGTLTVTVRNSGHFSENLTLMAQAPSLGLNASAPAGIAPGETVTTAFGLSLPAGTASGQHTITVTAQLASTGGSAQRQTIQLAVPAAHAAFSHSPATVEPGQTLSLTITNDGGAAAVFTVTFRLLSPLGSQVVTAAGTTGLLAPQISGQTAVIPLALPDSLAAGSYTLVGQIDNSDDGAVQQVQARVLVDGLRASIETHTDQAVYQTGQTVNGTVDISSSGPAGSGLLHMEVVPTGAESLRLTTHTLRGPLQDLYHSDPAAAALDSAGRGWYLQSGYNRGHLVRIDANGTPGEHSDDSAVYFDAIGAGISLYPRVIRPQPNSNIVWFGQDEPEYYTGYDEILWALDHNNTAISDDDNWVGWDAYSGILPNPSGARSVTDIEFDNAGRVWLATHQGLAVLYAGYSTPLNTADDSWRTFTWSSAGSNYYRIATDGNRIWIADYYYGGEGLRVLDHNGTPSNTGDDTWQTFTQTDGLADDQINDVAVDQNGMVWIATDSGLSVLDWGSNLGNKADDVWLTFAPNLGGSGNDFNWVVVDENNLKWAGENANGLWALDDNGTPLVATDDISATFTTADGLPGDAITSLAAGPGNQIWLSAHQGWTVFNAGILDYGGTLANKSDDLASIFLNDGLPHHTVHAVRTDANGVAWTLSDGGFSAFDDGGTLTQRGDDQWLTYDTDDLSPTTGSSLIPDPGGPVWFEWGYSLYAFDSNGTPVVRGDDTFLNYPNTVLPSPYIELAQDGAGRLWIAPDSSWSPNQLYLLDPGAEVMTKTDDTWYTLPTPGSGPAWAADMEPQPSSDQMWASSDGLWLIDLHGAPGTPASHQVTRWTASDGLTNWTTGLAVQDGRYVWIGEDWQTLYLLDTKGTLHNKADDQIVFWTTADGLMVQYTVYDVLVAEDGRVWISTDEALNVLDPAGTPLNKADDSWTYYPPPNGIDGTVWDLWQDSNSTIWLATANGLTLAYESSEPAWEKEVTVSLGTPGSTQVNEAIPGLSNPGKYYLQADLRDGIDQRLDWDRTPFYVVGSALYLQLQADRPLYRTGAAIQLSGSIHNPTGAAVNVSQLTVTQNGTPIYSATNINVPPGGSIPFGASSVAPGTPGALTFVADADGTTVTEIATAGNPALTAALDAPTLVGNESFSATVTITNSGSYTGLLTLDANLQPGPALALPWPCTSPAASTGGQHGQPAPVALTVPAGQVLYHTMALQIAHRSGSTLTVEASGDLTTTLTQAISYGLALEAQLLVSSTVYPTGTLSIPFLLTNTGQLPIDVAGLVSVHGPTGPLPALEIGRFLPLGSSAGGMVVFDASLAGAYQLQLTAGPAGSSPLITTTSSLTTAGRDTISLVLGLAQGCAAAQRRVTAALSNQGSNDFVGSLALEADLGYAIEHSISLGIGDSTQLEFSIPFTQALPGQHLITGTLWAADGRMIAQDNSIFEIVGPDINLMVTPQAATLIPGEVNTITFPVINHGDQWGEAELYFQWADVEDQTVNTQVPAGETRELAVVFFAPDDLEARDYIGSYIFSSPNQDDVHGIMQLSLSGISLTVGIATDQPAYRPGDPVDLTLAVTNHSLDPTPAMLALSSFNRITDTQPFTLAGGASTELHLSATAAFTGEANVLLGLFVQAWQRSVYLNTWRLREAHDSITLLSDKLVYAPGETMQLTAIVSATGTLHLAGPGGEMTSTLVPGNNPLAYSLPDPLANGTHVLYYGLRECDCSDEGRVYALAFDVNGPQLQVRSARLSPDGSYHPGDSVQLDLVVYADRPVTSELAWWLTAPDGSTSAVQTTTLTLADSEINLVSASQVVASAQLGTHWLDYAFRAPADATVIYAAGAEALDVGVATLVRLETDQASYASPSAAVSVTATLFSHAPTSGTLALQLDGTPALAPGVQLTGGIDLITITLPGGYDPGWHTLTATLEIEGAASQAGTTFVYGTSLPDLVVSAPNLDLETETLQALVTNVGRSDAATTTVAFYDDTTGSVLLGSAPVPPLTSTHGALVTITQPLAGWGGTHLVRVVADSADALAEFDENNNVTTTTLSLPSLELAVTASRSVILPGERLTATLVLTNLIESAALSGIITPSIHLPDGQTQHATALAFDLAAGESATLEQGYDTSNWPAGSYLLSAIARPDSGEDSPVQGADSFLVLATTDLALRKAVEFAGLEAGATVTFTLVFTNQSTITALVVTLSDTLPAGLDFGGVVEAAGLGPANINGQTITWVAAMVPGQSGSRVVYTTTIAAQAGSTLVNTAAIQCLTPELDTSNNQAQATLSRRHGLYLPVLMTSHG